MEIMDIELNETYINGNYRYKIKYSVYINGNNGFRIK